jgi:hypothetical protein
VPVSGAAASDRDNLARRRGPDAERRRREIGSRIERIAEMYKWGDLTREAYRAERERLEAELGTLRSATNQAEVLVQAATLLKDLPAAWEAATSEQRKALARLVFESIEIEDDRIIAVVPQPDFAPFFLQRAMAEGLLEANSNGATFVAPSREVMNGRKRRGSLTRDRCGRVAAHSRHVFRASAPLTLATWGWALLDSGQRIAYPAGAVARGSSPGSTRRTSGGGARLRSVARDGAFGGALNQHSGTRRLTYGAPASGRA